MIPSPARISLPADHEILAGHPAGLGVRDGQVAQQLLHDARRIGAVADRGELLRVGQQRGRAQRDHVGGRVVPGHEQELAHDRDLAQGHRARAVLPGGQPAEHVVAGIGALALGQLLQVAVELLTGRQRPAGVAAVHDELSRHPLEEDPIGVRHAEQFADHQGRERQGERLVQIGRVRPGQQAVEELVDGLLDPGPQRLHLPEHEVGGHQPPVGDVLGRVHLHERLHPRVPRLAHRVGVREPRPGNVHADTRIGQQGAHVGIPRHHPWGAAVPEPHP